MNPIIVAIIVVAVLVILVLEGLKKDAVGTVLLILIGAAIAATYIMWHIEHAPKTIKPEKTNEEVLIEKNH